MGSNDFSEVIAVSSKNNKNIITDLLNRRESKKKQMITEKEKNEYYGKQINEMNVNSSIGSNSRPKTNELNSRKTKKLL